jgi:membrane-bound serine protease (ClpP class)
MKQLGFLAVLVLLLGATVHAAQVALIKVDGAIGPATATYISRALDTAAAQHDECLIIQLNTPGGLADSMNEIVDAFYTARVPTVVYVGPEGAMAASAGCYITLAADVAAMAPHTTIGAAHPVELESANTDTTNSIMMQKVGNMYAKIMQTIAEKRHRNVEWAKSSVIASEAITSEEALKTNAIDLIAADVPALLKQLDGRKVGDKTLHTAGASVVEIPMNSWENFSRVFLQPGVMFALMLMVIYGIIGELSSPGAILPGVVGAIALVLVLYMSAILPVSIAGLMLIGLAVLLFIADTYAATHGVLTTGGIIAFFLGALMLFNRGVPGYDLSLRWIISATVITALFFIFVVSKGIGAQFRPAQTGANTMVGKIVNAQSRIDSAGGRVFIEGEIWNAVSSAAVEAGQPVEIIAVNGLTLQVKPKN